MKDADLYHVVCPQRLFSLCTDVLAQSAAAACGGLYEESVRSQAFKLPVATANSYRSL
jgi:hypothetical protein